MQDQLIEGYRLSAQQKQLWLSQQASSAFRAQSALLLEGDLRTEALKKALGIVVGRHEILRTTFQCVAGMAVPLQVIGEGYEPSWRTVDLTGLDPQTQAARIEEEFQREGAQLFDFAKGPMLRLSLLILSAAEHMLLISLPALCADAWTLKNLAQELSRCYADALNGGEAANEPTQYLQFSEWQHELIESEDELAEGGRAYWRKRRLAAPLAPMLPFEREPDHNAAFGPETLALQLDSSLGARIEQVANTYEASSSDFLLACWQTLLWRLSGQSEIVVSALFNGRKYEELVEALGLFTKSLPVPVHLESEMRLSEVLRQVQKAVSEAEEWQEYYSPAESGTEATAVPGRSVSFSFVELGKSALAAGVSFSLRKLYTCIGQSKLRLSCVATEKSLTAAIEYDARVYDREAIERLAGHFEVLVKSVIENPEVAISEIDILTDRDWRQLVKEFNQTEVKYPQGKCVHQLFETQVERTPEAVAAVFGREQLTYSELNGRANQLAHFLRGKGVGPETRVGISMERSLEIVVGLLGILKAGAAYLPLDPDHPRERHCFMLEDAAVSVLLTQQRLAEGFAQHQVDVICLDRDWHKIAGESIENRESGAGPDNLAYVIYTSGSTGNPKGVMVPHQGLLNYLNWCVEAYQVADGCGSPVHSSIGFDLTITSLFSPLLVGRSVALLPEDQGMESLAASLRDGQNFSLLKITPAHLELLSQLLTAEKAEGSVKALVIGGEALWGESLVFWRDHAPATRIINEYGPTETVVGCCVYEIAAGGTQPGPVPIGRPIANTQVYLLDRQLKPVPVGVPGEVCIGGHDLGRGYLNRPELTAESFIANPFSRGGGERLYKTGDLARFLPSGEVEYLGRVDHQVKLRGYRIELGEIEAVLNRHPKVSSAVAIVRKDQPEDKRLVAYLTATEGKKIESRELRQYLREKLPNYMVPAAFVVLHSMPLTANGKVDRLALPAPDRARRDDEATQVTARTLVEEVLTQIWSDVLAVEKIGINDNFFELGGDSILSIQIIAKAHKAGLGVSAKQIFQYQTIAELAAVAGTARFVRAEQGVITGSAPLTPIQHWFFEQDLPDPHHFNQAILLEAGRPLDLQLLERACERLLVHHDALRLRFSREKSGWEQFSSSPGTALPLTRKDLSKASETEQRAAMRAATVAAQASLNLTDGPLLRLVFFDFGPQRSGRLLIVIHHLAIDGVSWRILLEDLQTAYDQLELAEPIKLPPKTTSFKQWAERLKEYAQSGVLAQEQDYWLESTRRGACRLPVDHHAAENTEASADAVSLSLSVEETQALLQKVPAVYGTQINDVLLTALVQAFGAWTGESRLLINLDGHGREEILEGVDLSRTIGWFTSIFPVLLELSEEMGPGDALKAIRDQLRQVPNRGIGYGILRYLTGNATVPEQLRSLPQPEVSFNYQGQFGQDRSQSSLLSPAPEDSGPDQSPRQLRKHLLDVVGLVAAGQLRMNWIYNKDVHRRETIEALANNFTTALQALISHCQSPEDLVYKPQDFPLAALDQESLNDLSIQVDEFDSFEEYSV
jgi:amino acid adenylation domain-containing protein/non-ribosomal peptide synthase protein (TIGR01720 family)